MESSKTPAQASWPKGQDYTIEPHGNGHALYRGRDFQHHGLNLAQITEASPDTLALIATALNTLPAPAAAASEPRVHLEMTLAQAAALVHAADLYTRLGIGQFEALADLVRMGTIPVNAENTKEGVPASPGICERFADVLLSGKDVMGFHRNGSRGIGHPHNDISVSRTYEVKKVLDRALAMHRDPNPRFRGVNYDGLIVRYTTDAEPVAVVHGQAGGADEA